MKDIGLRAPFSQLIPLGLPDAAARAAAAARTARFAVAAPSHAGLAE